MAVERTSAAKGKDVSTQLSQVLDKLLKDYVKERYQSVNQVLTALKQVTTPTAKSNYTPKPAPKIASPRNT